MIPLTSRSDANHQTMFASLAARYDAMNHLISLGQDVKWQRWAVDLAQLPPTGRLLDLGAGTGNLALEAVCRDHGMLAIAADLSEAMMQVGRSRPEAERVRWLRADAYRLPFPDEAFDAVTSGYFLRNVPDVNGVLAEMHRVLKPEGRMVSLDTTPLPRDLQHVAVRLYMRTIVPVLGRLLAGAPQAYAYLAESTERFLRAEHLAQLMIEAGFRRVGYRRFMLSTMALHWGSR